jgi:hypothetical protein
MVIVIHQSGNTRSALLYNEQKVKASKARFFHHKNSQGVNPFVYSKEHRLHTLLSIEKRNTRVKQKCLHLSINPTKEDLVKIGEKNLRKEIDNLMEQLGYENQPWFVYKHEDLDRSHFHIVSTRIDVNFWMKIKDNYEKEKTRQFILQLEKKYGLSLETRKTLQINLLVSSKSENLKETIQQIFHLLNDSKNIGSEQEYRDILKALNIEIKACEKGRVVLINDNDGHPVRHPLNLSEFEEQPGLNQLQLKVPADHHEEEQLVKAEVQKVLKELYLQYRFFTLETAREAFLKHNLVLYKSSKNGNFNIYVPQQQLVCNAQFLLKKHFVRLKDFSLSNDDFFGIIKEHNDALMQQNHLLSQGLLDPKKSTIDHTAGKQKPILKELKLQESEIFRKVTSVLNPTSITEIEMAVRRYYEFTIRKILGREEVQEMLASLKQEKGYWEKIGLILIRELAKGVPEGGKNDVKRQKRKLRNGKGRYMGYR